MGPTALRCLLAALAAFPLAAAEAADRPGDVPLRVPRVAERPEIDGRLDEPLWDAALAVPVDVEVRPGDNVAAPVRTVALLAYDDRNLYVGFRAHDPEPSRIRARYADRDEIYDDDWVAIVLDTFNDERRSFNFTCNPLGVQGDMIETPTGGGTSWDAIWDSAGQIGPNGYTVEMAIPFSSLRFNRGGADETWGFDAVRSYPRGVRHHIGAFPRDRGSNCYLCQALKITGFAGADPGRNLELDPTLSAVDSRTRDGFPDGPMRERESDVDPGLSVRWSMTPNLTWNGAVNPDFSQVEADAAQLAINTRFALFYPEKRPFFLEGMDYFQLPVNVVYTRTLADPDWGAKLSGKVGRGALGFFTVRDAETQLLFPGSQGSSAGPLARESVGTALRYRHDVGESSTVGVVATSREGGEYHNRMAGLDAILRFTREDTLYLNAFGSRTRYPESIVAAFGQPAGEISGSAIDAMYMHATRSWEEYIHYQDFDDGFRADLGFVPQVGYRFLDLGVLRAWYHDDPGHWYNQARVWVGYERTEDPSGNMLRDVAGSFLLYDGPRQSHAYALLYLGRQSFRGVEMGHDTFSLEGSFQPGEDVEVGGTFFYGDAIDAAGGREGRRLRWGPAVKTFVGRHFQLLVNHTYERLWVDAGRLYTAHLSELRAIVQPTRRTFFRAIVQHSDYRFRPDLYDPPVDSRARGLLTQILFSYTVNPQTAIYVGYSDRYAGSAGVDLTQTDRTFFAKVGYAWVL